MISCRRDPGLDDDTQADNFVDASHNFISVYHKDAFLTFRAICKISMKGLHDDSGSQLDPIALQNKYVSKCCRRYRIELTHMLYLGFCH
jgi:hypothetical protein